MRMITRCPAMGLVSVLALGSCGDGGPAQPEEAIDLLTVSRGEFRIVVGARAELQAAQNTRVASALQGRSSLIYLVPEGTMVEVGDKIAELDVSHIQERRATRAIEVARAEAVLEQSRKSFEIVDTSLRATEESTRSILTMARLRHERFVSRPVSEQPTSAVGTNGEMVTRLRELLEADLTDEAAANAGLVDELMEILGGEENLERDMGEIANLVLRQVDEVKLARASLELAADSLTRSEDLFEQGFISKPDLERDRLRLQSQESRVDLAWNSLALLIKFDLKEKLVSLVQDVTNAELGLGTVVARNDADRLAEQVKMASAEAEYLLGLERLENLDAQLENAVMLAPSPGLVVYARGRSRGRDNSVQEGMEVRQGQMVITLPDVTSMVAELNLPEMQVDLVTVGQEAVVRVSSDSSRTFTGKVTRVGALPVSGARGSANQYPVVVALDGENTGLSLRPGMHADVKILAGVVPNALTVPVAALHSTRGRSYVWIAGDEGPRAAPVVLGANNATHVEVTSGLREGDRVYVGRPPGDPVVDLQDR